jgi:hypothetical protein
MDYSVGVIPMGAEEDCCRCVLYACWWAFIIFHLDGSSLYWGWPDDERFKDLVFFLLLLFFFFNFILTIALPPTLLKRRKDGMGVVYSEITPFWWVSLYSSRTSSYSPPLITLSGKHIAKKKKKKKWTVKCCLSPHSFRRDGMAFIADDSLRNETFLQWPLVVANASSPEKKVRSCGLKLT